MRETNRKQIILRTTTTLMTAAMMILIFFFSTEPADKSDKTSGQISRQVIDVMYPDYPDMTGAEQKSLFDSVQHAVRKTAHFTEYTILGLLIRFCLQTWFGTRKWSLPGAWAAGTLYAGTDELHQLLIDGRSGQWSDVILDSAGVLTGAAAASLIIFAAVRRKRRKDYGV